MNIKKIIEFKLEQFKELGIEEQSNGTILIGKALHVAPLAWLHTIFKGLNNAELSKLESKLDTDIPIEYKAFLKQTNGLHLFNTSFNLFGLRETYNRNSELENRLPFSLSTKNTIEKPLNVPEEYFIIGSYDWDGSNLYIDKSTNKVYRSEKGSVKALNEWANLHEMISFELDRLISQHNKDGTEINTTEPKTPRASS